MSELHNHSGQHYYSELIRIVSILFVGVFALMTFLLTIGFQRPNPDFSWALYTAIIVLALNLVVYVIGHALQAECDCRPELAATDDTTEAAAKGGKKSKLARAKSRVQIVHIVQQVLFVAAVLAVTWLALSTSHYFFNIAASSAQQ